MADPDYSRHNAEFILYARECLDRLEEHMPTSKILGSFEVAASIDYQMDALLRVESRCSSIEAQVQAEGKPAAGGQWPFVEIHRPVYSGVVYPVGDPDWNEARLERHTEDTIT